MLEERKLDPLTFSVVGAQLDAIVREMTLIMTYTGRSAIFNCCHDFSVTIASGGEKPEDIQVLSMFCGLPDHAIGVELAVRPILELYEKDDIREGDMFLNNCAYYGGSHHADYTLMSPVFFKDEVMFWAIVRCHQNDCGYHEPDTYAPFCKDIYEEGPNFPVV
ncbi:MAG: hydantoinase B/oxoprolinase family protein, partial [Dehalococcoidia bacterium]|nr:hydantoinase B/oxoprolinase family protein [Dehalococcoidia bacterium]